MIVQISCFQTEPSVRSEKVLKPTNLVITSMEGVSTVSAVTKPASSGPSQASQTQNNQPPQEVVNRFWKSFNSRYPGKVFNVLPREKSKPLSTPTDVAHGQKAVKSYEEAKRECEHAVSRIVKECLRGNQKYTDSHFDIELDLKSGTRNCLDVLSAQNPEMTPKGVKRVTVSSGFPLALVFFAFPFLPPNR